MHESIYQVLETNRRLILFQSDTKSEKKRSFYIALAKIFTLKKYWTGKNEGKKCLKNLLVYRIIFWNFFFFSVKGASFIKRMLFTRHYWAFYFFFWTVMSVINPKDGHKIELILTFKKLHFLIIMCLKCLRTYISYEKALASW